MQQFRFAHPLSWGYPPGLEEALNRHLKEQGIQIIASNEAGTEVYIRLPVKYQNSIWSLTDNGGEINVEKVNSGESFSIPTSYNSMPRDGEDCALTFVVWLFAVFHGEPIDYQWRP